MRQRFSFANQPVRKIYYCGDRVQRVTCVQCGTWVLRVHRVQYVTWVPCLPSLHVTQGLPTYFLSRSTFLWLPTVAECMTCVPCVKCVQRVTCVSCPTERKARNTYWWAALWCRLWHFSGVWNACSVWHAWSAWHAHVRWSHALPATDADTFGWVICVQCVHCLTCVSCVTCPG